MPSDTPPKPLTVPPFVSSLPAELLADLSPRDKRFYEEADRTSQKLDWLMQHSISQAATLEEVKVQAIKTNGGLIQAKADIVELKEATAPVVRAHKVATTLVKSKWTWIAVVAFFTIGVPFMAAHSGWIIEILKTLAAG